MLEDVENQGVIPEIRIKDAWLLRENVSVHLHELWGKDKKLATAEQMQRIVKAYQEAWEPFESKVLHGMSDTLGLSFRQNIIDVYIAPWFWGFSDPLVLGVVHEPDVFVDILTHELVHRLLTDNTSVPYDVNLIPEWEKLFGKQSSRRMLVHIPVQAVLKAIFLDVLNAPERLERDIERHREFKAIDYVEAWEYVEKHDYKVILDKLRKSYKELH